jgi:hypothetical protein
MHVENPGNRLTADGIWHSLYLRVQSKPDRAR